VRQLPAVCETAPALPRRRAARAGRLYQRRAAYAAHHVAVADRQAARRHGRRRRQLPASAVHLLHGAQRAARHR